MGQDYYLVCDRRGYNATLPMFLNEFNEHCRKLEFVRKYLDFTRSTPPDTDPWQIRSVSPSPSIEFADLSLRLLPNSVQVYAASLVTRFALEEDHTFRLRFLGKVVTSFFEASECCYFPDDSWQPMEDTEILDALEGGATYADLLSYFQRVWGPPAETPESMIDNWQWGDGTPVCAVRGYFIDRFAGGNEHHG